jgi:MFS family permease
MKKVSRRSCFGVAQSPKPLPAGRSVEYFAWEESQQENPFSAPCRQISHRPYRGEIAGRRQAAGTGTTAETLASVGSVGYTNGKPLPRPPPAVARNGPVMHFSDKQAPTTPVPSDTALSGAPWWREMNRYHWFVLIVAALGWLFDTMDQQIFTLARAPAMKALLAQETGESDQDWQGRRSFYASVATAIFLLGWATGGVGFGILGDRIGRARVMLWTILVYSAFTGLSALSTGFWDFALYRFLTGLGVGGEFAVGVALVAEVMPDRVRPFALGLLQALSAIGNVSAALINMGLGYMESQDLLFKGMATGWRVMFVIGTVPALLVIFIRRRLKEPERWQAVAKADGLTARLGGLTELFGDARWRRNALVGLCLGVPGVVGLWAIGFFSYDLTRLVFRQHFIDQGLSPAAVEGNLTWWAGITSVMQNFGGFLGIYFYSWMTHRTGRRAAFGLSFVLAMLATAFTFWFINRLSDVFWMIPLMGFCQLALFGGYAIYFPELFPTRLRSTGTSFCYNVGRYVTVIGVLCQGMLTGWVFSQFATIDRSLPLRYAGVAMCTVFLLGLLALPFAPETRGQPLPE